MAQGSKSNMPTLRFQTNGVNKISQSVVSHLHLNICNSLLSPRAAVLVSPSTLPSVLHILVVRLQSEPVHLTGLLKKHQRISSFNQEAWTVQVTSILLQPGLAKISSFCIFFFFTPSMLHRQNILPSCLCQ